MKKSVHGANIFELSDELDCKIEELKDFSSNINPFGISEKALYKLSTNLDKVSVYPDPNYTKLKNSISKYCRCNSQNILLGSGASAFINSYIKMLKPINSLILSPAYSEYENELKKINSNIYKYTLSEEKNFEVNINELIECINKSKINTIILCNPNNPTGSIIKKEDIIKILENTNSYIIIDETYIEFTNIDKFSCVSICDKYDRLFVIRGTSKFFACPGVRLGYSITSNEQVKQDFEKYYNIFWDINIFADIMGQEMFLDTEFQQYTFEKISNQREYIIEKLSNISSLKVYKSYGNFILVRILDEDINAKTLYNNLLSKKQIIRDCSSFSSLGEKYFRICVLKEEDNEHLLENIKNFFDKK